MDAKTLPTSEHRSDHHVLHIYTNPEDETDVDIFHPGLCGSCDTDCPIEHHFDTIGTDEVIKDLGPGFHRVIFWASKGLEWDIGVGPVGEPEEWWEAGRPDPASTSAYVD